MFITFALISKSLCNNEQKSNRGKPNSGCHKLNTFFMIRKSHLQNLCYAVVYPPVYLLSMLPYFISNLLIGRMMFFLTYYVFRYRYPVVLQNISRSLPQKDYKEVKQLAKEYYLHLAAMIVEVVRSFSVRSGQQMKRVSFSNSAFLDDYYAQKRNVIAVLGHYGNWECLNILPMHLSFQVNAIYKPLSNPVMGKLVQRIRTRFGVRLIPVQYALRQLLKPQQKPQFSLFIADQFPGKNAKCELKFLNQDTLMFNGAEKLAVATDAVVVYIDMKPRGNNCWSVEFSLITDAAKQTRDHEITAAFSRKLEQSISSGPAYWLWSHRRWK
ncbi:KDO2-lipid IV(A) lauroyltransferase [Pedobacter africanus]|uniref:KDO2-lipid IV(A) lauroyltransferase n=2 Tax=Pedobacter africanus TaxID=151894 RepID=A0A1W2DWV9_9SPHI|nr:KDO2-lipid IV(A) lauroyltransferase [Pedobacter africanus]